jgi:hypothetical protein
MNVAMRVRVGQTGTAETGGRQPGAVARVLLPAVIV